MPCANLCKLVNASVIVKCSLNFSSSFGRFLVSIGESFGVSFNIFDVCSEMHVTFGGMGKPAHIS